MTTTEKYMGNLYVMTKISCPILLVKIRFYLKILNHCMLAIMAHY